MTHLPKPTFILAAFAVVCAAAWPLPMGSVAAQPEPSAGRTLDGRYKGLVVPAKQVLLVAPLDGIVSTINVKKGDVVKANAPVALMDDEIQKLVVEAAKLKAESKAAITVAELAVEDARLDMVRAQDLFDKNAQSEWELQKKKTMHKTRIAEAEAAKEQALLAVANLKLEETKLRKHSMLAPFNGTVVDIVTEEGATLARNDKVMALAQLDELEARINLPSNEAFVEHMKKQVGKSFRMKAGEPVNREITGTLKNIRKIVDPGSATFLCEFTIANADLQMLAGFSVDLVWPQNVAVSGR